MEKRRKLLKLLKEAENNREKIKEKEIFSYTYSLYNFDITADTSF